MKKRNMPAILLLVCILLTLLCSAAVAETKTGVVVDGQTYTIDTEAKTATLTKAIHDPQKFDSKKQKITIPDTITVDGIQYLVTKIGAGALTYIDDYDNVSTLNFQYLYIGKNVESIADNSNDWPDFNSVNSIVFNGDKCLNIVANAFGNWEFTSNFSITVYGAKGCMDSAFLDAGLPETFKIKYIYDGGSAEYDWEPPIEDAIAATKALQTDINNAVNGVNTTLYIEDYIQYMDKPEERKLMLTSMINIPTGKNITLTTKDANGCSITASAVTNVGEMFFINAGATLTIDGNLKFYGGTTKWGVSAGDSEAGKGSIATVRGTFNLKNGILTGINGKIDTYRGAAVWVGGKTGTAEFNMTGGSIGGFNLPNETLTAAVVVGPNSTFNMSGGEIYNNKSNSTSKQSAGGGVLLYTWDDNDPAACMNLSGSAEIKTNRAGSGAGIYMTGNANLQMTGGTISDNMAMYGYGGGVCVAGANSGCKNGQCIFEMTGGTISGNTARFGGGVYVNSNEVQLTGGNITGNIATEHGGGIYVGIKEITVHLENVLIKENTATVMGGGLWLCPTGFAEIHVTNGGAIYNNVAAPAKAQKDEEQKPITDAAGDDIASLGYSSGGLTLADRMLGGGKIDYYKDGTVTYSGEPSNVTTGYVSADSVRFDPANPGEPLSSDSKTNNTENLALISVASDGAKALAEQNAKLVISGNTAPRGGGIGSNGGVIIGKKDETTYSLIIKKDWGNTAQSLWQEVTLQLLIDGNKLDEVKLNSGNEWMAELEGFAKEDLEGHDVRLEEKNAPAGFKVSVSDLIYDEDEQAFIITATNVYAPEVPNKPEIEIPKTGDSSHIGLMLAAMAASLLGLLACALAGKRRGNR